MGEYLLIMRSSMMVVFSEDYVLTAKAKGLSTFQFMKDHGYDAVKTGYVGRIILRGVNSTTVNGW